MITAVVAVCVALITTVGGVVDELAVCHHVRIQLQGDPMSNSDIYADGRLVETAPQHHWMSSRAEAT